MLRAAAIVLLLATGEAAELTAAGNAALVTVWGVNPPTSMDAREGDVIEVPLCVRSFQGTPAESYRRVEAQIRYDGARLALVGVAAAYRSEVPGSGIPGKVTNHRDVPRTADPADTMRRLSIAFEADADTRAAGVLAVATFKVKDLGDSENGVMAGIAWDAATVKDAAGVETKPTTQAPTGVVIWQRLEAVLSAFARLKQ